MTTRPVPTAGASLSDLLTAAKNLVQAVNALTQDYMNVQGVANVTNITAPTVVKYSSGRIVNVSVLVAGDSAGTVYDSATINSTINPLFAIPNMLGVFNANMPAAFGILVVPGTGQTVSVSYS